MRFLWVDLRRAYRSASDCCVQGSGVNQSRSRREGRDECHDQQTGRSRVQGDAHRQVAHSRLVVDDEVGQGRQEVHEEAEYGAEHDEARERLRTIGVAGPAAIGDEVGQQGEGRRPARP